MSRRLVVDASVLVTALLGLGDDGARCAALVRDADLAAPHLLQFEVANVLRRQEHRGLVDGRLAALALDALIDLRFEAWPFAPLAARAWALRSNLTAYDASYVALAEHLGTPLVTLDRHLAGAPGLRCEVIVPTG